MPEENLNRESPGPPAPRSSSPEQHFSPPPRKRRTWLAWLAVLALFAVAFFLVLHHQEDQSKAGAAAGFRRGGFGQVTITAATATRGNIGVYLDAIGTVTPVYTDSITGQASGLVISRPLSRRPDGPQGRSADRHRSAPYQAQLAQARERWRKTRNVLAQAKMDLDRYRAAWARNAIAKQTLDDQEKIVLQDEGTVKNDQGTVQLRPGAARLLPHHRAHRRPGRTAAGRSRQRGAGQRHQSAGGHHSGAAHHRDLHRCRGQPRPDSGADAHGSSLAGGCLRSRRSRTKSPPANC